MTSPRVDAEQSGARRWSGSQSLTVIRRIPGQKRDHPVLDQDAGTDAEPVSRNFGVRLATIGRSVVDDRGSPRTIADRKLGSAVKESTFH